MKLPNHLLPWAEARRRHRLSDLHVAMARELGLNPKKLGHLDNHAQEPWKQPLPDYIEELYRKHFGRARPLVARSLEESVRREAAKKAARRERKQVRATATPPPPPESPF